MTIGLPRGALLASTILGLPIGLAAPAAAQSTHFERIATFPVYLNLAEGTDPTTETVAEIVTANDDGTMLIYTDGAGDALGMVDISDPALPQAAGRVDLEGEPTSVYGHGGMAYAGVNTAESFVEPSGHAAVIDLDSRSVVATCDVGGQPDSVAVSPDGTFLAVVVENERDEDLGDGVIPQLPSGHLAVIDLGPDGMPETCGAARIVDLAGLADLAPSDAEPEYVDINADNVAVVTLQENNHLVLVDLPTGVVTGHFAGGTVDLTAIDTEDDGVVQGNSSLDAVPREPDAVAWIDAGRFVTANEGDYEGGSRGFTIFGTDGSVHYDSGNAYEHLGMRLGHYPDGRADNKGMEPEGVDVGTFGDDTLIFVNAERGNVVMVYRDTGDDPELVDVLPTAVGPEGLLAIPERDLFVVATEVDEADEGIRATLTIFARTADAPVYPDIVSHDDPATGAPIGWGALSGLVAHGSDAATVYAVSDSFYSESRIYTVDVSTTPAVITNYVSLMLDGAIKAYDLEGIALRADGGFWVVSEGNANAERPNLLLAVAADGTVEQEVALPEDVDALMRNNGFEGVAAWQHDGGEQVVVAFQREWEGDPAQHVRLGIYTPADGSWAFAYYPIEAPSSPRGGWVGLSEITHLGDGTFAILERDNQPGTYATHKVVTAVSLAGVEPAAQGGDFPVLDKTVTLDLLPVLRATNGWISDKPEGIAATTDGQVYLVVDNDGVDDATGETQFLRLGTVDDLTP